MWISTVDLFFFEGGTQFETTNPVDMLTSNACKTSLLQHIGLLIKSKLRDVIFL